MKHTKHNHKKIESIFTNIYKFRKDELGQSCMGYKKNPERWS